MTNKPGPIFWVAVFLIVSALVGFSLHRMGVFQKGSEAPISPGAESVQPPPRGTRVLELSFHSSSAKTAWVDQAVKMFNDSNRRSGDAVIRVKTTHFTTSGGSYDQLINGKIKPDMWSPGDESWLHMAASHWRNVNQQTLFDGFTDLVNIPLVIAMWEPMARALGYPGPIGWKDIARLAALPNGWAALNHPEWGKFRWGHAHPDANSGFLTIVSEVYAALGKTSGITPEDLKNPKVVAFLREVEGAVEHYGLSNSWIDDLMHRKGPEYLSATVQYENTIIETNIKHNNKPFKLVAVYPTEGNLWTRHPVAILKGEWMTPEKEDACKIFIDFMTGPEAQRKAMEMGLRPVRTDMEIGEPFIEENGVKAEVDASKSFEVPGEDVLKRIRDLWEEVKTPATIVLILDRSGSMQIVPMENAKTGAIEFIKSMKPRDELKIVVFNEIVTELSPMCGIQVCGEEITKRLGGVFAAGRTSLYDAVLENYRLLNQMRGKNPGRRYSLLVLSDGQDTASQVNRYDFLDSLPKGEEYDAPKIFTIAYGDEADKSLLAEISNRTNGRLFESNPEEIAKTYKELSANF